jgi:hypothetical protein
MSRLASRLRREGHRVVIGLEGGIRQQRDEVLDGERRLRISED